MPLELRFRSDPLQFRRTVRRTARLRLAHDECSRTVPDDIASSRIFVSLDSAKSKVHPKTQMTQAPTAIGTGGT